MNKFIRLPENCPAMEREPGELARMYWPGIPELR
jgi:hypothetical protein